MQTYIMPRAVRARRTGLGACRRNRCNGWVARVRWGNAGTEGNNPWGEILGTVRRCPSSVSMPWGVRGEYNPRLKKKKHIKRTSKANRCQLPSTRPTAHGNEEGPSKTRYCYIRVRRSCCPHVSRERLLPLRTPSFSPSLSPTAAASATHPLYARTIADPSTLSANAAATPTIAWGAAPRRPAAPLLPPLPLEPVPVEPDAPLVDAGAEGVNVAEGFARHELAAADASWIDDGAFALTVAFPLKSHDVAARFVIS